MRVEKKIFMLRYAVQLPHEQVRGEPKDFQLFKSMECTILAHTIMYTCAKTMLSGKFASLGSHVLQSTLVFSPYTFVYLHTSYQH